MRFRRARWVLVLSTVAGLGILVAILLIARGGAAAPGNQPTADAGADQGTSTGAQVTLDGSGSSDADGDGFLYTWTQTGGAGVVLSDPSVARPTFTAPSQPGTLTFSLTVDDGRSISAADEVTISVGLSGTLAVGDQGGVARWTADFDAAFAGAVVTLQVAPMSTADEGQAARTGWEDVTSGGADGNGDVVFEVADPSYLARDFRAIVGEADAQAVSNVISHAASRESMGTGLATVYVDTADGADIDSQEWLDASFMMLNGSGEPQCATVPPVRTSVRGRGNFTWTLDKKPYNLNLSEKVNICGMGASKKWALLANHYDRSLLRTSVGMYMVSQLTNLDWTPASMPVDLYVNGEYRGSYTLIERIDVSPHRVDIDELTNNQGGVNDNPPQVTGGYLLEWDARLASNDHYVEVGDHGAVGIMEPEDAADGSGITPAQIDYIDQFLDEADAALFGDSFQDPAVGWRRYIDADSAVDYVIAMELTKPEDANLYSSVMMVKERDTDPQPGDQGRLHFGPVWDLDTGMGNEDGPAGLASPTEWYVSYERPDLPTKQSEITWFNRLFDDPEFVEMVRARWVEVYPDLLTTQDFIEEQRHLIADSAEANFTLWDVSERLGDVQVIRSSWPAEVDYLASWLSERIAWMDSQYRR